MIRKSIDSLETNNDQQQLKNCSELKNKFHELLNEIEKEYNGILLENVALRKELEHNNKSGTIITNKFRRGNIFPMIKNRVGFRKKNHSPNNLIFSSNNQHQDIIWDVQIGGLDNCYIGSASADKTAIIWCRKTGYPLLRYEGHCGSVNSCRFGYFDPNLVLTTSGDHEIHIWKISLDENIKILSNSLLKLKSTDIVSCAEWFQHDQIVSTSWDKSATIWNIEMGNSLRTLYGHDGELTYVSCHQTKPLILTSSRDETFRLWDCRISNSLVEIFHGHTKTVNSTLFISDNQFISSSDDGFVHIWDLRSTNSSPFLSFECISPCNRLSLFNNILSVPLDNRDIRLYSIITGEKLYIQKRAHKRAVQCTSLVQSINSMELFLASGSLDCQMHTWNIQKLKENHR
ncbi:unnamed protein product [Adineta steineri]|uniref:Uncharacterized protein n=1 Tax=Adineta steineri TaxID=433720 RepID=A0A813SUJ3_9BILA|nr:unnamed protein product [Adineta steineri]CAF4020401.1 unnamed protein product [Adineta steineri]